MRAIIAVSIVAFGVATIGCKKPAGEGGTGAATATAQSLEPVPHMTFPGTPEGARQAASEFLKPNANLLNVARSLRPDAADYAAVFPGEGAEKVKKMLEPGWEKGRVSIKIIPGHTELVINAVTVEDMKSGAPNAAHCPAPYKEVVAQLNPTITMYCFKFVKPGETLGMTYDGLIFVNGHWAIFPKSFHALRPAAPTGTTGGTGP